MNGLVSIIVPVYNSEHWLDRCVKSILGQTYHNIKIILIDDGSQDVSVCQDTVQFLFADYGFSSL